MIKRTLSLLPNLLIFSLLFCGMGCYIGKPNYTVKNGRIPPDFSSYKDTLLVLLPENDHSLGRGYTKFLKSTFETNYHGPYKMVDMGDLYFYQADQYRYIYSCAVEVGLAPGPMGPNGMNYKSTYIFGVNDRTKKRNGYFARSSGFVRKEMTYYVVALDNERQSH
jgi:hypothetical protein